MVQIKQIDGLQTELDAKSATGHSHSAADITSGTFASARIPSLAASKITSGTFTSARIPSLAASKITSGTFSTARIPSLAISKITGLQTDLDDHDSRITTLESAGGGGAVLSVDGNPDETITRITMDSFTGDMVFETAAGNLLINVTFIAYP